MSNINSYIEAVHAAVKDLLDEFGYKGEEILMHPETANTDTAENWAYDAFNSWGTEEESISEQFGWLEDITDRVKKGELVIKNGEATTK